MRFSIVVPVYGVEKYLDECINSLLKQTYTDFEIILVDDRSPDNCPQMCDGYAQSDSRVRVIHKPQNEGLGFARNTGLEAAKGDYVIFADSDDTIDPKTLERCFEELKDEPDIWYTVCVFAMKIKRVKPSVQRGCCPKTSMPPLVTKWPRCSAVCRRHACSNTLAIRLIAENLYKACLQDLKKPSLSRTSFTTLRCSALPKRSARSTRISTSIASRHT
ncbi:MAG: glycosyltransferase family 2 protein [Clostridia bacterium]|nr:glycosyltransferase family 2 protein [Clostridia bacterium]